MSSVNKLLPPTLTVSEEQYNVYLANYRKYLVSVAAVKNIANTQSKVRQRARPRKGQVVTSDRKSVRIPVGVDQSITLNVPVPKSAANFRPVPEKGKKVVGAGSNINKPARKRGTAAKARRRERRQKKRAAKAASSAITAVARAEKLDAAKVKVERLASAGRLDSQTATQLRAGVSFAQAAASRGAMRPKSNPMRGPQGAPQGATTSSVPVAQRAPGPSKRR